MSDGVTLFVVEPSTEIGDGEFEGCKATEATHYSIYMIQNGQAEPVGDYEIETHWGNAAETKEAAIAQAKTLAAQYGVEVEVK